MELKKVNPKDGKLGVSSKSLKEVVFRFACIIFIFLIAFCFVGCNDSKIIIYTTKIDSLEWTATAEVQEWKSCDESGWEVPEGAIVYKEQEEIKSYKIVGYETKYRVEEYQELVGYYRPTWRPRYETRTRKVAYQEAIKEPVYATKYYYTIERWVHLKYLVLARGYDQNYNYSDYVCGENERVYNVEFKYLVHLECDESHVSHIVDKNTWESLQVGQEISGKKNQYGHIHVDWDNVNNNN